MRHSSFIATALTLLVLTFTISLALVAVPSVAAEQGITNVMKNALSGVQLPSGGDNPDAAVERAVGNIIQAFISIFGVLFLGLMVYGGYKWMIAQGREDEVSKAKDIIRAAIIGLGVVLLSYAITYFVLTRFLEAAK